MYRKPPAFPPNRAPAPATSRKRLNPCPAMVTLVTRRCQLSIVTPSGPSNELAQLNERSREIFRQIVETYLATGEPVGSRNISRLLPIALSPASVRNVMQDLEVLGLIQAPHTSAGRLPTELGLRFFVDAMLEFGDLSPPTSAPGSTRRCGPPPRAAPSKACWPRPRPCSRACRAGPASSSPPSATRALKHIEFVRLEPTQRAGRARRRGRLGREPRRRPAGRPADLGAGRGRRTTSMPACRGTTLGRAAGRDRGARSRPAAAELDEPHRAARRGRPGELGGRRRDMPQQLIVRGQANLLEDLHGRRGSRAHPPALRRSRDQEGPDRPPRPGRGRRRRAHLHRLGEQALLALRLLDDRGALPRRRRSRSSACSASSARRGSTMPASCRWWTTRPASSGV